MQVHVRQLDAQLFAPLAPPLREAVVVDRRIVVANTNRESRIFETGLGIPQKLLVYGGLSRYLGIGKGRFRFDL